MSAKNDGGPAFPVSDVMALEPRTVAEMVSLAHGMTLRDYFAAKAMQGYLANSWQSQQLDETGDSSREQMAIVAEISYVMADAMLLERAQ